MSLRKYDPSYDRAMLLAEIRRLQREKRLVFAGETLEAQLGAHGDRARAVGSLT